MSNLNWTLLKNSLLVSGGATLLALVYGFAAALWLMALPSRWRNRFLAVAIMALALPPFLVTNTWMHLLGAAGAWRRWLPFNILSLGGAVWILSLLLWPIPLLAVGSAWKRLEPAQLESDLAVTGWALLRLLLWPLARVAFVQAAVLVFILALNNFAVPTILQVPVFPAEMWIRFNAEFDTAGALKLSWPLVILPLVLLLWFSRRELPWPHLEAPVSSQLFRRQLGTLWFRLCGALALLVMGLSVAVPVGQILSLRRTWTELPGAVAAGHSAIWNSFRLPILSATLIIGVGLAWVALLTSLRSTRARSAGHGSRFGACFAAFLWLPFLLPGVLLGIGLINCFNHAWSALFYQSIGIVVLAFAIRYLAAGWQTVAHAAQAGDANLLDVARLEGASGWQTVRHVYWPQIAPRVAAGWYVIFLLCLWDVESMILVVPPGDETLALRIFNLLHYGYNAQVNALCLTLLVVALVPLVLWQAGRGLRAVFQRFLQGRATAFLPGLAGLLLVLAVPCALCSCSDPRAGNEASLNSELFDRVEVIGTHGVGVGQFNQPRSLAIDDKDRLYVVDMTGRVQRFSPAGAFQLLWQMPELTNGRPKGMGRDWEGNIIVVEPHYQRLNHFTTTGQLLDQWGQKGTNFGQFWMPRDVAVDSRHEIFVSEYGVVERIQKFVFRTADGKPRGMPTCVLSFGRPGTGPGEFNRAEGLCMDSHDRLYVADSCNHRIQVFTADGKFLRAHGKPGSGLGELSYPYAIYVDAAGRQYVSEFGNSRVQVFDADDRPIEIIGGPGSDPGQFNNPWGLAMDSQGDLYVVDSQNHRVQKLIAKHKPVPSAVARVP